MAFGARGSPSKRWSVRAVTVARGPSRSQGGCPKLKSWRITGRACARRRCMSGSREIRSFDRGESRLYSSFRLRFGFCPTLRPADYGPRLHDPTANPAAAEGRKYCDSSYVSLESDSDKSYRSHSNPVLHAYKEPHIRQLTLLSCRLADLIQRVVKRGGHRASEEVEVRRATGSRWRPGGVSGRAGMSAGANCMRCSRLSMLPPTRSAKRWHPSAISSPTIIHRFRPRLRHSAVAASTNARPIPRRRWSGMTIGVPSGSADFQHQKASDFIVLANEKRRNAAFGQRSGFRRGDGELEAVAEVAPRDEQLDTLLFV